MLNTNMAPSNHSKLGRVLITGGWHDNKNSSRYSGQSSVISPRSSAQNVPFTLGADLPPAGRGEPGAVFEGERGVLATSPPGCQRPQGALLPQHSGMLSV